MSQLEQDPNVDGAVLTILAAALSEYRAAFAEISDEVNHGRAVTPQQLERAMSATLQLENAQTLFELDARDRLDAQQATPPRSVH
jgi:hypothetical protein